MKPVRSWIPLLAAAVAACVSSEPQTWHSLSLQLAGDGGGVITRPCKLAVEVVGREGISLGVMDFPVAAGAALPALAQELASSLQQRFQVRVDVAEQGPGTFLLTLQEGYRFGSVFTAMTPARHAEVAGARLVVEQVGA
ncbi:MAG: hypothetical protein EYC70_02880 [Planctomycetota bacterium]|nr:MAG: hypothetical protein EYC70_02880 [Planctomycetota bacterium]